MTNEQLLMDATSKLALRIAQIEALNTQLYDCIDTLEELVMWARWNTSPRDDNSPHEILVAAVNSLNNLPRR